MGVAKAFTGLIHPDISPECQPSSSNGIHSEWKIKVKYPQIPISFINELYSGQFVQTRQSKNETLVQMLKEVDFDEFSWKTYADIFLVGCSFMNTRCYHRWKYDKVPTSTHIILERNGSKRMLG